ncbi:MAG: TRAP transporter TatT component family protein [Arenimonas sp.]|nr:TRAP transporter TatT component family protein [Arenimonas sp.]
MAEYYARLLFDQELHDRLLAEVLAADPVEPGFTLMNVLAQQRAQALQASGRDYF